jgi:phospholipid-binding lipoprotein MlaA
MLATLMVASLLAGCATVGGGRTGPGQRLDPWERWNREVFAFNEALDENIVKPVAIVYADVMPQPVRQGISNFFNNASDAWSAVNNFLQAKWEGGFRDLMRFGTNTVFGVFGILDVASEMGIDHQYEDFGQTLGHWGMGPGAYVVWPLLGPSTVRESLALPLDFAITPGYIFGDSSSRFALYGLSLINTRANLLGASRVIDDIALDKYTFLRDAYLQRRRSLVLDGEEPPEEDEPPEPATPASGAAK